ncbi:MAG: phosphoribosyltransferase family protein [Candidatus Daviesbacteria bacterium]|nr:phosphoribosyltransferase family protein [Candidatus Daviesbacteria bacterium]
MKIFKDRQSAGKLLTERLKNIKADLVLGIPRGGVVVAAEVARQLNLPLDIIVTRKIGAPNQEELALGAVDPDGEVVWDQELLDELKIKPEDLKQKIGTEIKELKRREKLYRQGRSSLDISGKTVILTDDGMATGSTTLAAVKYLKRHEVKVILAVPVASQEALDKVENEVGKLVVLEIPEYFQAVGQFYQQFLPVSDEEVIQLMLRS